MKKISFLIASSLIGLSLSVQAAPIAIVDGQPIDKSVQDEWIKELVLNGGQDTPEARKQILDNLVASVVVENAAKKQNLLDDPKVKIALDYAKFKILQEALIRTDRIKHPITDEAVKARYDMEKDALGTKEYEVSHILVKDEKTAQSLIDRINKGEDFSKLAKENSTDPGAKDGYLGWNKPVLFVKPFSEAMTKLKNGEVTQKPVKTEFGWHVIKVQNTREVPFPEFDSVKNQIREMLEQKAGEDYID
ncbi:MAG: peptidylprolyl isomerase, partial [Parabacteroides sp.]|nr:peptidylprolyl isomerase [Parabacteroides sp.]